MFCLWFGSTSKIGFTGSINSEGSKHLVEFKVSVSWAHSGWMVKMKAKMYGHLQGLRSDGHVEHGQRFVAFCSKCGPWKQQDKQSREQPRNIQTHINIQDLVSGTFSQKGLSSSARNLIWTLIGEHRPSTLVFSRPVNCPVPVDDGAARTTSQGCRGKWHSFSGKPRVCTKTWTGPPTPRYWLIDSLRFSSGSTMCQALT